MAKYAKILIRVLSAQNDKNIEFDELCGLLIHLGFSCRMKGSHNIFYAEEITEIINLQPVGSKSKPYQVRQVRDLITKYKLELMKDA